MAIIARPWTFVRATEGTGFNPQTQSGTINETISDTRTPLVKTPAGRWRPPTNYSRTVVDGRPDTYDCLVRDEWLGRPTDNRISYIYGSGARQSSGQYSYVQPLFPSNLESQAIIKARLKLKGMHVNLAQAFAERDQTVRLVASTIEDITGIVRSVKRLQPPRALVDKQGWFFNRWLELQYGWKPLLSDVYGAVDALHQREKEGGRGMVTVKANVQDNSTNVRRLGDSLNTTTWTYDQVINTRHKGFIRLDFIQSNAPPTGTLAQLGITNPLELAWELTPWSFVADWFVPVGDYLSSLDATLGWNFVGGSFSSKTLSKVKANNCIVTPDVNKINRNCFVILSGGGRKMTFNRKAYSTAPLPSLPSLAKLNKASHEHVANGIALLMSAIVGGVRVR